MSVFDRAHRQGVVGGDDRVELKSLLMKPQKRVAGHGNILGALADQGLVKRQP